jgi:sialate O-acetylesterase
MELKALAAVLLSSIAVPLHSATIRPAKIFSDHMVLQRERPVPVWGKSDAQAIVVVEFAGQSVTTSADDRGRWRLSLESMKTSADAREMVIRSAADRVVLRDVLVGDVWFAGGQSNMAYSAGQMARRLPEGKALVDGADFSAVRFRKIDEKDAPAPLDDLQRGGSWTVCTPQSAARCSATAFVFARRLHEELGVPIGWIDCSWGGTPIEPYIPREAFVGHPTLERLAALAKTGDVAGIRALPGGTFVRSNAWLAGAIYNGRIAPVVPYAIRGAIWYQGESNCGRGEDPRDYAHKMRALIKGWRQAWGQKDLPFYFVQLPQWSSYAWTYLREEQRLALDVNATGMVVTIDLDNADDIHPPNKIDVGERLARWPLAKLFSRKVAFSGPIYRGSSTRDGTITVMFDAASGDLMVGRGGGVNNVAEAPDEALHGFELVGDDGVWREAQATIRGHTIVVGSKEVPRPLAVRYACHPQPPGKRPWNLYNKAGLPASPFCSDWKRMPYNPSRNPTPK